MMKLLFAGDLYPAGKAKELLTNTANNSSIDFVKELTSRCDHSIVNLEAPICDPQKQYNKIEKTGPNICGDLSTIKGIAAMGFDVLSLANNHILDFGDQALLDTLGIAEGHSMLHYGAGRTNAEARQALTLCKGDLSVALLAFAENEFGNTMGDYPGAAPLKLTDNFRDIARAKAENDFVVVSLHGSHEHYPLPSPSIQDTCRFFVDCGADAVVVHHPHCLSGYELHNGKPIFYSLGNFIFDSVCTPPDEKLWSEGYIVTLDLQKGQNISFEITPIVQYPRFEGVRAMTEKENSAFQHQINKLNSIIASPEQLTETFEKFAADRSSLIASLIEQYPRSAMRFVRRGILPTSIKGNRALLLLNIVRCEAHRDVMIEMLKQRTEKPTK